MIRPRTFYGWKATDGKYHVSLFDKTRTPRPSNSYDTKEEAEAECVTKRSDGFGAPTIVWEH